MIAEELRVAGVVDRIDPKSTSVARVTSAVSQPAAVSSGLFFATGRQRQDQGPIARALAPSFVLRCVLY